MSPVDEVAIMAIMDAYVDFLYTPGMLKSECKSKVDPIISSMMDGGVCTKTTMIHVMDHIDSKSFVKADPKDQFLEETSTRVVDILLNTEEVMEETASFEELNLKEEVGGLVQNNATMANYHNRMTGGLKDLVKIKMDKVKRQYGKMFDPAFIENF